MTVLQSIFLGLLQGFTEFLPVSSSGHLILAERLFDLPANLFFDVMLHLGTLAAAVIALRKSLWSALRHPVKDKKLPYLLLASLPTFAIALAVKLFVPEKLLKNLLPVGFALTIALIVLSEKLYAPRLRLQRCGVALPLVTGAVQGLALLPGLSRSCSTIAVMKFFGVTAEDSAEFSFLLSVPIIAAGGAAELWEALKTHASVQWSAVAVGTTAAFLSGLVAVNACLRIVKGKSWVGFAVYLALPLLLSLITM